MKNNTSSNNSFFNVCEKNEPRISTEIRKERAQNWTLNEFDERKTKHSNSTSNLLSFVTEYSFSPDHTGVKEATPSENNIINPFAINMTKHNTMPAFKPCTTSLNGDEIFDVATPNKNVFEDNNNLLRLNSDNDTGRPPSINSQQKDT